MDLESWAVEKIGAHVSGNAASRVSHGRKFVTRNKQITTEKQSSSRRHVSASRPAAKHLASRILRAYASLVAPNDLAQQATPKI